MIFQMLGSNSKPEEETNGWRYSGRRVFSCRRTTKGRRLVGYGSLDAVICQMKERFGDHQLQRLDCISKFSPKYLKTQKEDHHLKSEDISYFCDIYGLDSTAVASEMNSFRSVFGSVVTTST